MPVVHPNYIKASNLTLVTVPLGIINMFLTNTPTLTNGPIYNTFTIVTAIFVLGFIGVIAYFIRQGYPWMKIALLILLIIGTIGGIPTWLEILKNEPIVFIINTIQFAIQTWAVVLLFKIPTTGIVIDKDSNFSEPL